MAEEKHVSGMRVGPLLTEEEHDAVLETRKRRKQVAQQSAQQRDEASAQPSGSTSDTPQQEG